MFAIYLKEINNFFSSIIAYVVIIVFLVANGVFLWLLPESNIFDFGYASLDQLFELAPWVFMFLVPAITMRSFAEERKSGTLEIILSKPVSDIQIILGKYFANLSLVLFALLPSLVYFFSVYQMASPVGNMDIGGTWGSYLGLFFLGAVYVSIGLLASSLSDNQIISFILALFICFFFYSLLDMLRGLLLISPIDPFLEYLSINTHYISMSRGVIDSRDMIYFISFSALFLFLSRLIMEKRKW
ncbi:MAG: gliding motility-associated ABC transporter permease subunit GldF [Bacteroidetes bacterium]|jgi:ABC-2 type transport system permease protein|nr:gliding motility-associated ABC transporter permease subunit GldF [Bacteroidota bacterium]MBT5528914.1 gliding motility-associated ABC transporter permease subunit GldF [Cytophagia bacterium]MBT4729815.1 gliding motility-associated ABC transporter permease subunit GldF [Bacteroidota bacterium]MBT4969291.1 gliding motility-associated ABC transporter permease subunit GldF [Bacteroidota bacterium]MBT5992621.1 gliding motility-associated ABC transporter permease subunit GldF [Bacteroidota bacter